jgi:hypothetical protein
MLAMGMSFIAFVIWGCFPPIPNFFTDFTIRGCWISSNVFSAYTKMEVWFSSFILFISHIIFIDLYKLNHPCIPGMKPTWTLWMIFHLCCSVDWYFAEYFCISIHQVYWPIFFSFLFYCCVLVWFWWLGNPALIEWVWNGYLLFNSLEWFKNNDH